MDNSFFLRSINSSIEIEKFQICTWEFHSNNSLIEFGVEIKSDSLLGLKEFILDLYIPWLKKDSNIKDYYDKLKHSDNSRFIFNDSVVSTSSLDDGQNIRGVIHEFKGKDKLCILPVRLENNYSNSKIQIKADLNDYTNKAKGINTYIRIAIESPGKSIVTSKKGIGKSTIIYDIKLNESRNIPSSLVHKFENNHACKINLGLD